MSFVVRYARASDARRLVQLHCTVFNRDTNYLMLLGRGFLKQYFSWYCTASGAFMLVAERSGRLAGYIAVNLGSYYRAIRSNWASAAVSFITHPRLVFHPSFRPRLSALFWDRARPSMGSTERACLAYLAVDLSAGLRGVAPALVTAALKECRSRGWYQVVTGIHRENVRALALYSVLGFESTTGVEDADLAVVGMDLRAPPPVKASVGNWTGREPGPDDNVVRLQSAASVK